MTTLGHMLQMVKPLTVGIDEDPVTARVVASARGKVLDLRPVVESRVDATSHALYAEYADAIVAYSTAAAEWTKRAREQRAQLLEFCKRAEAAPERLLSADDAVFAATAELSTAGKTFAQRIKHLEATERALVRHLGASK